MKLQVLKLYCTFGYQTNTNRGPGVRGPGLRGPGVRGPGLRGPGVGGPGLRGPGVRGPGVRGPGVRGPGVRGPGVCNEKLLFTGTRLYDVLLCSLGRLSDSSLSEL